MEGEEDPADQPEIIVDSKTLAEIGVTRIPNGEQEFFVVGTAHVSDESCEDVRKAVRSIQPDTLMVELCRQRAGLLFPPPEQVQGETKREKEEKSPSTEPPLACDRGEHHDAD